MITFDPDKTKRLRFKVRLDGLNENEVTGYVKIEMNDVGYSFICVPKNGVIEVNLPPLDEFAPGQADGTTFPMRLEVHANGKIMIPWQDTGVIKKNVSVEASFEAVEEKEVEIEDDGEFEMSDEKVVKYYNTKTPEEVQDRVLRFIGSNEVIDRDNEVILHTAWRLKNYRKNPVVLVSHNYDLNQSKPVARTKKVWIDKENKSLMFDLEFAPPEVYSEADTLYKLYKSGFLNAVSIGFQPNWEKVQYGKNATQPARTFKEVELLEISLVSVPANPEALITSKSMMEAQKRGVIDELEYNELKDWYEAILKDIRKDKEDEVVEETTDDLCNCGCKMILTCPDCMIKEQPSDDVYEKLYRELLDAGSDETTQRSTNNKTEDKYQALWEILLNK